MTAIQQDLINFIFGIANKLHGPYGRRGGKAKIVVRKALLYYALRRLGLDTDPTARRPQDQQIVLLNQDAAGPRLARQDNGEARV
ncbi:hypothetical protein [Brucella intermedia]|uniref:hypothetical protein n=1 Tax=Brucella intermedia TaxID=94625 RepID=UPI001FFE9778|nr:hypothetical protein [Brucella intermedia]